MKYFENVTELIGGTPLVKLNKVTEGIACTVLAKVEYFNPGGSIKDRIAAKLVDDAERRGLIEAHETRLTTLREAAEMYRTGRSAEIMVPKSVTPEEDQAQRARLVDKLVAARRERDRLDSEIDRLNALLH